MKVFLGGTCGESNWREYLKCPVCGKDCYIDEKNNDFACIDENCLMKCGYNEYLDRAFSEEIPGRNCEVTQIYQLENKMIKWH